MDSRGTDVLARLASSQIRFAPLSADSTQIHEHKQYILGDFRVTFCIYHSEYTYVGERYVLKTFKKFLHRQCEINLFMSSWTQTHSDKNHSRNQLSTCVSDGVSQQKRLPFGISK